MSRSFGAAWPDITLQHYTPRETITARDLKKLAEACNWLHAQSVGSISQAWSDGAFSRKGAGYTATHNAIYRIPDPGGGRTSMVGLVRASNTGTGNVRLVTSVGGSTSTSLAVGADAFYAIGPVTCDFSLGYEEVKVKVIGDAVHPTIVTSLFTYFAAPTSPLASGSRGGYYPFDLDELDDDAPVSADLLEQVLDNLTNLLARNRVYYTWSGLTDVDDATVGTVAMPPWQHRGWTRAIPGAADDGLTETVYASMANPGATDETLRLQHGGTALAGDRVSSTAITSPAGVTGWQTTTVTVGESGRIEGYDYPLASIMAWPATARAGSDAEIRSLTVWGR